MSERNPDSERTEAWWYRHKNNPIENPVIFANVGASLDWTQEQLDQAVANLNAAAARCGLTAPAYIELVAPRPRRARG